MKKYYLLFISLILINYLSVLNAQCKITVVQALDTRCDNGGSVNDPTNDSITLSVAVQYSDKPSGGKFHIKVGNDSIETNTDRMQSNPFDPSGPAIHTFKGFKIPADGKDIKVIASFKDSDPSNPATLCDISTSLGTAPDGCAVEDADNDGIPNPLDFDDDNDGLRDLTECRVKDGFFIDYALLIDGSGSIADSDFNSFKESIAQVIETVVPKTGELDDVLRLTTIIFSDDSKEKIILKPDFVDHKKVKTITGTIRNIIHPQGGTYVSGAIKMAVSSILAEERKTGKISSKKIINIITDGRFDDGADAASESKKAKSQGFDALNIVGVNVDENSSIINRRIIFPSPEGNSGDGFYLKAVNFGELKRVLLNSVYGLELDYKDADGDGLVDCRDIDSDNDGIPDNIEIQTTKDYIAPSGKDDNNNGWDDAYDPIIDMKKPFNDPTNLDFSKLILSGTDTDGDGIPDYLDDDSDGDGTPDIEENGSVNTPSGNDDDGDGLDNNFDDVDGFHTSDEINTSGTTQLVGVFEDDNKNVDTTTNTAIPLRKDLNFREAICYKTSPITGTINPSDVLISGSTSAVTDISRPNGQLVIDSDKGGLVLPRISDPETSITDPKEGMIVFDTDDNCIKLYKDSKWGCLDQDCSTVTTVP